MIVSAMREATHHNLYAIANSVGMNGVGEATTIQLVELKVITAVRTVLIIFGLLFVLSIVMWVRGKRRFKQSEEYASYMAYKNENHRG